MAKWAWSWDSSGRLGDPEAGGPHTRAGPEPSELLGMTQKPEVNRGHHTESWSEATGKGGMSWHGEKTSS